MPNVEYLLIKCNTIKKFKSFVKSKSNSGKNFDLEKLSPSIKYLGINLIWDIEINSIPKNIKKI